ncbi:hypothetical protein [Deinococcus sp. JMULE3]|uniref:hypothetical protein n=1 Tax=Deinococcus sp. JMULE3 TaxID=2518341 RepID=UPI0015771E51|nr:hypothetical protein [Deinococcus sp. JMULE3]
MAAGLAGQGEVHEQFGGSAERQVQRRAVQRGVQPPAGVQVQVGAGGCGWAGRGGGDAGAQGRGVRAAQVAGQGVGDGLGGPRGAVGLPEVVLVGRRVTPVGVGLIVQSLREGQDAPREVQCSAQRLVGGGRFAAAASSAACASLNAPSCVRAWARPS